MFIGLPGLRHMRAKLDLSNPDKMVLDTGRGGCRHTITVGVTGKQQATVEQTADQLLPQPARKLGLPPGHTTDGFVNAKTQDDHDLGVAAPHVGAVALYDFLPDDVYAEAVRIETSELRECATGMVAAILYAEAASGAAQAQSTPQSCGAAY
jgi:hypothetical protein